MSESTDPQTIANEAAGSSKMITNLEEYKKKTGEIDQLMAEAEILYSSESYGEAADKYEIAVKTATEFFGQFSHECFQPALNYGKALIEVARLNVQLVDKPLDGIYEEDEELEDEELDDLTVTKEDEQKNEDKMQEENKANQEGGNSIDNEIKTSQLDQILATKMGEFKPEEEQEEEDPDDIQTAWEWLEVARKICEKQQETTYWLEWKSNVLMALGECMTVADEFEQALAEFINALEIRQKIFAPHDRRIAETHFFIALSQKNLGKFDKAAEQYEKAKQILEGAIDAKKKEMDSDIKNSEKLSEQIAEMEGLIKSLQENIQDAHESAESCPQNTALSGLLPETKKLPNPADALTDGVEVNDMSDLVKRKPLKRPLVEKSVENVEMKSESGAVIEKKEQNRNELVEGSPLQPDQKRVKICMDGDGNEKKTE